MILYIKYKRATRWVMGITSLIFVFVIKVLYPWASHLDSDAITLTSKTLLFIVTVGGFYTVLFSMVLTIYEKYIWRLLITKYDYNGYWKMKITYEFNERKSLKCNTRDGFNLPYVFESVFKIEQNLFGLKFTEGFSAKNETWEDKSLRILENGFNMSYEINRSDKKPTDSLPSRTLGYEEVIITSRNFFGNPIYMQGRQYHVALPDVPLYRGTTTYERINKSEYKILLEEMRSNEN